MFFACGAAGQENEKEPVVLRSRSTVFYNHDCERTGTCTLKRAEFVVERYKIWVLDRYHYGKRLLALYETDSVGTLEDYTFIQFFRGCRYTSESSNGSVTKTFDVTRWHSTMPMRAVFPRWTIDTYDAHPDYCADPNGISRHYLCRWKRDMQSDLFSNSGTKFYGLERPAAPALYMTDRPSSVFAFENKALNNSFAMRTCLYRTTDVPRELDFAQTEFAEPLYCFEWANSFVYNHATEEFEEPEEIIPECFEAVKRDNE